MILRVKILEKNKIAIRFNLCSKDLIIHSYIGKKDVNKILSSFC